MTKHIYITKNTIPPSSNAFFDFFFENYTVQRIPVSRMGCNRVSRCKKSTSRVSCLHAKQSIKKCQIHAYLNWCQDFRNGSIAKGLRSRRRRLAFLHSTDLQSSGCLFSPPKYSAIIKIIVGRSPNSIYSMMRLRFILLSI